MLQEVSRIPPLFTELGVGGLILATGLFLANQIITLVLRLKGKNGKINENGTSTSVAAHEYRDHFKESSEACVTAADTRDLLKEVVKTQHDLARVTSELAASQVRCEGHLLALRLKFGVAER